MNPPRPQEASRARRAFVLLAATAAVLTLVVIVASAFMRHAQAGLSCEGWPACYAQERTAGSLETPAAGVRLARIAHRLAASTVSVAILLLLLIAWMQAPAFKREGRLAALALLIVGALAALGVATPGARLPAVVLGNLLGGYLLLAVLVAACSAAAGMNPVSARARALARATLVAIVVQALLGGLIGAQYASAACPALTDCGAWSWREFLAGGAWSPMHEPEVTDGRLVAPAGAAGLHVLHRLLAVVAAILGLWTTAALWRARPRVAAVIGVLFGLVVVAGLAAALAGPALAVVVAHNAGTAALLAALAVVAVAETGLRPAIPNDRQDPSSRS